MCNCASGGGSIMFGSIPPVPVTCTTTKQEYIDWKADLIALRTSFTDKDYYYYLSVLISQINSYDTNCSLFENYILTTIVPRL